jgi:hypothetical protein
MPIATNLDMNKDLNLCTPRRLTRSSWRSRSSEMSDAPRGAVLGLRDGPLRYLRPATRVWASTLERLGLPGRLACPRRSAACMVRVGWSAKALQVLGHASVAFDRPYRWLDWED